MKSTREITYVIMLDAQVSQSAPSDVKIKQRPRIYTSPQIFYAEYTPTPCSVSNKHNESGNDANILVRMMKFSSYIEHDSSYG